VVRVRQRGLAERAQRVGEVHLGVLELRLPDRADRRLGFLLHRRAGVALGRLEFLDGLLGELLRSGSSRFSSR
jgi:hypothetical protein